MEKETKILVGAGALVALYLLYNKYQKDVLNKKVVMLPVKPVVTLPVEPVVTLPVEPAPFEPLPIFTNPIDDFINPVVPVEPTPIIPVEPTPFEPVFTLPVEPTPFEPVFTLPVEPTPFEPVFTLPVEPTPFEPAPFEPLPIFTNPIDDFINPVVPVEPTPFEPVFTLPVEPAPVVSFEPVPVESIMIGTVLGNDLNEICASEERTLLFTSLYDWNRASTWSGLTFYEDSQLTIPVTNAKYIKKWMDNNRNIYEISNGLVGKSLGDCIDLIQTTNKLTKLDPKIWGGTIGVNFILGNTLEDICNKQKSQNVSDITKLYLEQELWTAYYQNLTGVTLFIDESLKTPYGDGFITTFGLDGLTIYEISNGIVGKSLGTCSVLINKPIIESINPVDSFVYSAPVEPQYKKVEKYITIGNAINDFTVLGSIHRDYRIGQIRSYATNIINSDKIKIGDKIRIYKSDDVYILGTVTQYNSNGLLFYKEEDSVAPSDNVMYSGFSIQVLDSVIEPIEPQPILANAIDEFVFQQEVYEEPYTVQGGAGFSAGNSLDEICNSQKDPIVIYHKAFNGLGTYGQLGAKLYKDREVKIPYTDSIYVTRWRANPRQEIMKLDGNGTVIEILSPC